MLIQSDKIFGFQQNFKILHVFPYMQMIDNLTLLSIQWQSIFDILCVNMNLF